MAKKKRKGTRRRRKGAKKRSSGPKAKPLGMAGGVGLSGLQMATQKDASGMSVISRSKELITGTGGTTIDSLISTTQAAIVNPMNYKYALVGLLVTASPKIPIVNIVARPANRGLRRLTKGKWGL